jgi:tetratricopeptide (TPR) repeat protein
MHKPYPVGYDEQLKYVDRLIGTFKQSLEQTGLWDRALVILLSDHGEGLGDHGEDSHGYFIYESTLHVPLIIHWPASAASHPARVTEPVGLIDIAPTVLDFLHFSAPPSFEGGSLMGAHQPVYAESVHARDAFGWAPLRSLRAGQFKYIEAPRPELYDLNTDPHELKNLYVPGSAKANDLRGQLAKLNARYVPKQPAPAHEVSSTARALLDSLGYLAPGPRSTQESRATTRPDPKDKLAEFRLYEDAWVQIYYGRLERGIAKLRQLLAGDPHNLLARRDLGSAYAQKKDYASARSAYRQVLAGAPEDYVAQYEIGIVDERLGLLKEAKEHLETACRIEPESQQSRHELDAVLEKLK